MVEKIPNNVTYMEDYLEGIEKPDITSIRQRIADIAIEQLLLHRERQQLEHRLRQAGE